MSYLNNNNAIVQDNDENMLIDNESSTKLLNEQKNLIYKHPLFPFLVYILEKCEEATLNPLLIDKEQKPTNTFEYDIKTFLQKNFIDQEIIKTCENDNLTQSVDDFFIHAIQVLRIHLLELEKVNELCKDFCQRYIACLKLKLNFKTSIDENNYSSDNCTTENESDGEEQTTDEEEGSSQRLTIRKRFKRNDSETYSSNDDEDDDDNDDESLNHCKENFTRSTNASSHHYQKNSLSSCADTRTRENAYDNSILQSTAITLFDGQTPLSQIIGCNTTHTPSDEQPVSFYQSHTYQPSKSFYTNNKDNNTISTSNKKRKRKEFSLTSTTTSLPSSTKRGVLPKSATNIMRSWLFQHIVHPYPTEDEKRHISSKTNLSLLQVNNWFINARRRILQPMLEASNPDLALAKKKKHHHHHQQLETNEEVNENNTVNNTNNKSYPNNRYWPSNLALVNTPDKHKKKI